MSDDLLKEAREAPCLELVPVLADRIAELEREVERLKAECEARGERGVKLAKAEAELAHCKANHADVVRRKRIAEEHRDQFKARADRLAGALDEMIADVANSTRGFIGDHYVFCPQIGEKTLDRWRKLRDETLPSGHVRFRA